MPEWILPLLAFIALAAFIVFAFRQGMKVKPDHDNPDNWQGVGDVQSGGDGSHHGGDGRS